MSQISNERVLRVADKSGNEYYITDPNVPALVKKLNEQQYINGALGGLIAASNLHRGFQGERGNYEFNGVTAITLSSGHVKILYSWTDGGADYYTTKSPAAIALQEVVYDLGSAGLAALEECTNSNYDSVLAGYEYDEVRNI